MNLFMYRISNDSLILKSWSLDIPFFWLFSNSENCSSASVAWSCIASRQLILSSFAVRSITTFGTISSVLIEITLLVLCGNKCLQTEQEDDDGNNEEGEDESSHDDDPDAEALAGSDEGDRQVRVVVVVVNTVHGNCKRHGLGRDLRWALPDIWGQAQDVGLVHVGSWRWAESAELALQAILLELFSFRWWGCYIIK